MNAQSAAVPSTIDVDTLARAFAQYASMSSHGVTGSFPENLAVAKSDKLKWDTQKELFHTFKRRVMILAELLKIVHLLRPRELDLGVCGLWSGQKKKKFARKSRNARNMVYSEPIVAAEV